MPAFLEQFVDQGLAPDPEWTPEQEEATQQARLEKLCLITLHAKSIKRRLGGDASPAELTADKKLAKQVHNRFATCYGFYGEPNDTNTIEALYAEAETDENQELWQEVTREGAQIDWAKFWLNHALYLKTHIRIVATNAYKLGKKKDGNRLCNRLKNEYEMLNDILGPVDQTKAE
jgi:hypothetical protein